MKKINYLLVLAFFLCLGLGIPQMVWAAMTGGGYEIYADAFSAVDDTGAASGGTYTLYSTGGEAAIGDIDGGTYSLRGGFQAMEKGSLSLDLSTTSVSLGIASLTSVASTTATSTISTDSLTGYSFVMDEDGNLASGLNDIDDVADGTVSAGSEEYGISTFGGGGVLVLDTAIVDGLQVASAGGPVVSEETGIIFKMAIGGTSRAGSYTQTLTATLTVNP